MKKFIPLVQTLLFCCLLLSSYSSQAQCPASTHGKLSGNDTAMAVLPNGTTPLPVFTTVSTGLTTTEFVVIQKDSLADDLLGPTIMGVSTDGQVTPANFSLGTCNEFCIVPFSYDSTQINGLVDSLLLGDYQPGSSCCAFVGAFFGGVCDSLNARGIYSSADVTSISVLFDILDILNGGPSSISIPGLVATLDQLSSSLGLLGNCSGGATAICFAVDTMATDADYYIIPHRANSALDINIVPDTVMLNELASYNFAANVYPSSSIDDTLMWSIEGSAAGASIDPVTGALTAGTATTFMVVGHMTNACIEDAVVVIVNTPTGVAKINQATANISMQVQPNPFQQELQVAIDTKLEGEYNLRLTNITGQTILEQTQFITKGKTTISLNTNHLPAGLYSLQVANKETSLSQKVIKQ